MARNRKPAGKGQIGELQPTREAELTSEDLKLIRQLYLDGLAIHEIAMKFERPPLEIAEAIRHGRSNELCCSFCGSSHREVAILIAGPLAYICERCIHTCIQILIEEKPGMVQITVGQSAAAGDDEASPKQNNGGRKNRG